jgi:CheY-like chemotaxis protein
MNHLNAGMEELIRRTVGPAISVQVWGDPALWLCLVDANQLENALLNLCINARDAMPDGGSLRIFTENASLTVDEAQKADLPPGDYVKLAVRDTGIGMTRDVMSRAFDPFFTTKPIGQGTGLGLSMIYGFVQQSGGHVQIASDVGKGTTVSLLLPRHLGAAEAVDTSASAQIKAREGEGECVLVVDDEPAVRMLLVDLLQEVGYTVIEAATGAEALEILEADTPIDLMITDVGLPGGMNGRQVASVARALRPRQKVLFITGYAETGALSHAHLEAGMHVLTKPFEIASFTARVRQILLEP